MRFKVEVFIGCYRVVCEDTGELVLEIPVFPQDYCSINGAEKLGKRICKLLEDEDEVYNERDL